MYQDILPAMGRYSTWGGKGGEILTESELFVSGFCVRRRCFGGVLQKHLFLLVIPTGLEPVFPA